MDNDLLRRTTKYFDNINFGEMNERWIDEVIDNEFTDVEDNRMSISLLFVDEAVSTLLNICRICDDWSRKSCSIDLDESRTGDVSSRPEEVLWTFLDTMDVSVRQILGVVYLLCSKAMKTTSSMEDKEMGLLSAKWYFCCLRVPGSAAYSVFYPNLFRLCIDCFQMPDPIDSKDALYKWRDFEDLLQVFVSALESLVPMLSVFHFGTDSSTIDHVIQKLCELVGSEISNVNLNFELDFLTVSERDRRRKYSSTFVLTSLSYQGLSALVHSDLNGEKDYIYSVVLSGLNRHILCLRVRKSTSIPSKFLVIKDNAVLFICHNLKDDSELCSKLTLTALKRLCLSVSDKADFRSTVSQAVFTIMYHLQVQNLAELLEWLLRLVDASETNNRVFALEVLGLLLGNVPDVNKEGLPEEMEMYLTPLPVIFSILTRCDDVSPAVRTKALSILSQHMKRVLNVLAEMQDTSLYPREEFEEEPYSDVNGDHRSFWYGFQSFKEMLNEMANILHRRIEDNNGIARKAALQALESIITFDIEYVSEENLKLFVLAAKDPNIVMRKQMIQSLTAVLETYPENTLAQEYWLRCILPLVLDPENTVQSKVLSVIEDRFLHNILSERPAERDAGLCLLGKLSHGEFLSHQRYLQKAFSCWRTEKKLRPLMVTRLEKYLGNDKDELVWFYLSIYGAFCKLPSSVCQLVVEELENQSDWTKSYSFMEHTLKVLRSAYSTLESGQLESVRSILVHKLENFAAPVEILPLMIEILCKIAKYLKQENDFAEFSKKMTQTSLDCLSSYTSDSEDLAIKCFTIIKEFCLIYYWNITPNVLSLIKSFVSSSYTGTASACIQAHAFAALGKMALQDEALAKELLPLLAKELLTSKEDMIRNNVVLILIEMVKRHTSFADKYVPLIIVCFKDKRYMVRYQSITLLVSLMQEDYLKWKGPLLYCLLSTIIDKKEAIQELGKYCLCQLVYEKKKSVFADGFVNSIFVFNGFPPPDNEGVSQMVNELKNFAIPYDERREKRMQIYRFMLDYMEPASRAYLVQGICQDILSSVAEGVFPLNKMTETMVRDCFAILSSREIRVYDTDSIGNDLDEGEEETAVKAELAARRLVIVEPVIPVIISLKNCIMDSKTQLLSDIVSFLKDILQDYKNDVNEILAADKMLNMQVLYELRNDQVQQEKETRKETRGHNGAAPRSRPTNEIIEQLVQAERDSVIGEPSSAVVEGRNDVSVRFSRKSNVGRKSNVNGEGVNDIQLSASGSGIDPASLRGIMYASTPRVVLKQLSRLDLSDVTRIEVDDDDD